jgi:hypothetical protein
MDVRRFSPGVSACLGVARVLAQKEAGLLYLNSFFDPVFTIWPLILSRCLVGGSHPVLLAPRGELAEGALRQKAMKKRFYLCLVRLTGLYRSCSWHASGEQEKRDILNCFPGIKPDAIFMASNMVNKQVHTLPPGNRAVKEQGCLKVVFAGRITPVKNVLEAIRLVGSVKGVSLTLLGPVSDEAYWRQCRQEIERYPETGFEYRGAMPHEELGDKLAEFDLLIVPSQSESFGHVIVEALQAGCPVLVSDRTPWEGLEEKYAGWVCPLDDTESWRRVLDGVKSMSDEMHKVWREGARKLGSIVAEGNLAEAETRHMFERLLDVDGIGDVENLPITVLMMTLNAEEILPEALDSLRGRVQDVIIVDSRSADRTIDIALHYGAKVVQRTFTNFGDHWRWITEHAPIHTPWTFILASDERMTESLYRDIRDVVHSQSSHVAFSMKWRLWFMGQPLHVISRTVRLFRTGRFRIGETVCNEQYLIDGTTGALGGILEHKDSPNLLDWQNKQNIYSTMEAIAIVNKKGGYAVEPRLFGSRLERRMFLKKYFFHIPFRYPLIFLYNWVLMGAWRDGRVGLAWAHLRAEVYRMREFKALEMRLTGHVPKVPTLPCGPFDPRIMRSELQKRLLPETVAEWERNGYA